MSTQCLEPNPEIQHLTAEIAGFLCLRKQMLAVAESCTGGLIAQWITTRPGSSTWFDRGLVTYSNQSKADLLDVPWSVINDMGPVSGPTVLAMADGLLNRSPVDWVVSVSGIAGPGGGSPKNRVGTVWIGWAGRRVATSASCFQFDGNRAGVRCGAAKAALSGLLSLLVSLEAIGDKPMDDPQTYTSRPGD